MIYVEATEPERDVDLAGLYVETACIEEMILSVIGDDGQGGLEEQNFLVRTSIRLHQIRL